MFYRCQLIPTNTFQLNFPLRDNICQTRSAPRENLKRKARLRTPRSALWKQKNPYIYLPSRKPLLPGTKSLLIPQSWQKVSPAAAVSPSNSENRTAVRARKIRHLAHGLIFQWASGVESHRRQVVKNKWMLPRTPRCEWGERRTPESPFKIFEPITDRKPKTANQSRTDISSRMHCYSKQKLFPMPCMRWNTRLVWKETAPSSGQRRSSWLESIFRALVCASSDY